MNQQQQHQAPAIGQPWPGQGGIYAGVARGRDGQADYHLILAAAAPDQTMNWAGCVAWAAKVEADGHADFSLPSRFESALLYANVQNLIDAGDWYWTGTEYSASSAWIQYFYSGNQYNNGRAYEAHCRAVRRLPINPSILSAVDANGVVA